MLYISDIRTTAPDHFLTPLQEKTYEALALLQIPFQRVETDEIVTMEDCVEVNWKLQMKMVKFLHSIYPRVNIALHAGELTLGLVPTTDLRFHIKEAVEIGQASRIGHGVDIMWEQNSDQVLKEMARNDVAIEIMPVSNKVILGAYGEDHPFPVYFKRGVPIVLASDDAGVLRTDLSEQFVIIASDYPQIKYRDFKKFVRNSIEYSFLQGRSIWSSKGDYFKLIPE